MSLRIGFLINPIAGMGGPVGLKGTDGAEALEAAVRLGAPRRSPGRAGTALRALVRKGLDLELLTSAGEMGERVASGEGFEPSVVHRPAHEAVTTPEDTARATEALMNSQADLLMFCGGDGTAKDVVSIADMEVPVVGIPAGVKMHSSVFAHTPEEAADLVESFARSWRTKEAEVMDVDEEAFRRDEVSVRLYAVALIPDDVRYVQSAKAVYSDTAAGEAEEIAAFVAEDMESGVLYVLGPGSTTAAIASELGERKTGLGVDAFVDRKPVGRDLGEEGLLELLRTRRDARIVVTPIGSQGFIFGRGNQQISPNVLRAVGKENIMVVATPTKLRDTPVLRVDTGDRQMDDLLRGRIRVVTGYGRRALLEVL
ncbi:MAG: ATP-NAD kinase family protein [Methanobacteriota archaeon]|nr:MAG: ATP-NAD kinase family protein [Euryarchaeota archaeon]